MRGVTDAELQRLADFYTQCGVRLGMTCAFWAEHLSEIELSALYSFLLSVQFHPVKKKYKNVKGRFYFHLSFKETKVLMKFLWPVLGSNPTVRRKLVPIPKARKEHIQMPDISKEQLYCLYWEEKLNTVEIGKLFNLSSKAVYRLLQFHDIKIRSTWESRLIKKNQIPLTGEQREKVKLRYPMEGPTKLAEEFGCSLVHVMSYAKANKIKSGVRIEKRAEPIKTSNEKVDLDYFTKNLFGKDQSYVVGFIWSDGNIQTELHSLRFKNKVLDEDIILKIKAAMNVKYEIARDPYFLSKNGIHQHPKTRLTICSSKLVGDLMTLYGLCPAKSRLNLDPPRDLDLVSFARGMLDGDGHVLTTEVGIQFMGAEKVLLFLAQGLRDLLKINYVQPRKRQNLFVLSWSNREAVEKIYHALYDTETTLYGYRKRWLLERQLSIPFKHPLTLMGGLPYESILQAKYQGGKIRIIHQGLSTDLIITRDGEAPFRAKKNQITDLRYVQVEKDLYNTLVYPYC